MVERPWHDPRRGSTAVSPHAGQPRFHRTRVNRGFTARGSTAVSGELAVREDLLERLRGLGIDVDELETDVHRDGVDLRRPRDLADRDDGAIPHVERHAEHIAEIDLAADRLEADPAAR